VVVVPAGFEWDDLGSWDAVGRVAETGPDGNSLAGDGETLAVDAANCVLAADEGSHVSVVGVEGLTVATYDGRTLVVPREESQRGRRERNIYIEVRTIKSMAMSVDTDSLRELYIDVAGEEVLTESQQEDPSHDPIGRSEAELEADVSALVRRDGLDDAVQGAEFEG